MASEAAVLRQWIKDLSPATTPCPLPEDTPAQVSIREGIRSLATGLTDPNAERRLLVMEHILSQCIPAVQCLIVDHIVDIVKGGGPDAGPAVASLAQFGNRALPALTYELVTSRDGAIQLRVVQVT